MRKNKKLIVITGPTAAGKTNLAVQLAQKLKTEIVSFDSRQLYHEMHIGTAVPSAAELSEVKHHFIQSHSIHDEMNAGVYEVQALEKINSLFSDYDILIFTGGTGLYMDAVLFGVDDLPVADLNIRKKLADELEQSGLESLTSKLKLVDAESYRTIDLKNPRRVMRALEVFYVTGKTYPSLKQNKPKKRDFDFNIFIVSKERKLLYEHINQRVDNMIEHGLEEEAKQLMPHRSLKALQTVGYSEFFDYFDNKNSYENTVEKIKQNSRNYAKRQLTWFRKYPEAVWVDADVNSIMQHLKK